MAKEGTRHASLQSPVRTVPARLVSPSLLAEIPGSELVLRAKCCFWTVLLIKKGPDIDEYLSKAVGALELGSSSVSFGDI